MGAITPFKKYDESNIGMSEKWDWGHGTLATLDSGPKIQDSGFGTQDPEIYNM